MWQKLYGITLPDTADTDPPISVPADQSSDPELFRDNKGRLAFQGSEKLEGTPFDYRLRDFPDEKIVGRQSRNGQAVNATIAGHKRFPIWLYRQETVDIRALDGR